LPLLSSLVDAEVFISSVLCILFL